MHTQHLMAFFGHFYGMEDQDLPALAWRVQEMEDIRLIV
jgi:hypothetical protein